MCRINRIALIVLCAASLMLSAGVSENFSGFKVGPAAGGVWRFDGAASSSRHTRIVDSGMEYYGNVLRLYPAKGATPSNVLSTDFGSPERIVVDFDFRVHGNQPAFTIALLNRAEGEYASTKAPERSVFWMMADGDAQSLQVFCGNWITLAKIFPDQWYHIRVVCYITGEFAETCDVHINGGIAKNQNLPFRNKLLTPGKPILGEIYLAGRDVPFCDDGNPDYYGDVDNITVTAIGGNAVEGKLEPPPTVKVPLQSADSSTTVTKVDFDDAAVGPAAAVEGFRFGGKPNAPQHAQIIECPDDHGNVLRVIPSAVAMSNVMTFKSPALTRSITCDFDFRTQGNSESVCLALGPAAGTFEGLFPNAAYNWIVIDPRNICIYGYSGGWKMLSEITLKEWHHAKMVLSLTGDDANTYRLFLDGNEIGKFPFRNFLFGKTTPGTFFIEGREVSTYGDGRPNDFTDIDNIVIRCEEATEQELADTCKVKVVSGHFDSEVFGRKMPYSVLLPDEYEDDASRRWPVLFLFHGRGRNHASLVSDSEALTTLKNAKFVVAFPNGEDGWYVNSPVNPAARYNDYAEEFVKFIDANFRVSDNRAHRGISGWSMGGYGCTMYAETHADDIGALAPMIGLLDYPRIGLPAGQSYNVAEGTFGNDEAAWAKLNPINGAQVLKDTKIAIMAADAAFDRTMNRNFDAKLNELGIQHEFQMVKGAHSFEAVKLCLEKVIEFMNRAIVE